MVSLTRSSTDFSLQGLKLLIHQLLQTLFILLGVMTVFWFMIQMKQMLKLPVKMKITLLFYQVQEVTLLSYQISVCTIIKCEGLCLVYSCKGGYLIYLELQELKRDLVIEVSLFHIFINKVDYTQYWSRTLNVFLHFNNILGRINYIHPGVLTPTSSVALTTQQIKIPSFPYQMNGLDLELFLQVQLMPLWFGIFLIYLVLCCLGHGYSLFTQ